jgi:hypothetical protein
MGQLRYIYGQSQAGPGNRSDLTTWVAANCTPVPGFDTATRNMGAPDGTGGPSNPAQNNPGGGFQVSLYDCRPAK